MRELLYNQKFQVMLMFLAGARVTRYYVERQQWGRAAEVAMFTVALAVAAGTILWDSVVNGH